MRWREGNCLRHSQTGLSGRLLNRPDCRCRNRSFVTCRLKLRKRHFEARTRGRRGRGCPPPAAATAGADVTTDPSMVTANVELGVVGHPLFTANMFTSALI